MRLGGMKTKKEAVNQALFEYVQRREQLKVLDFLGKVELDPEFDYKKQRNPPVKVLVDTDVWSEALRKKKGKKSTSVDELVELIQEGRLEIIGPIRMEVLSDIRDH